MDSDGEEFEGWRSPTVSDENSGAEPMSVDDAVKNITIFSATQEQQSVFDVIQNNDNEEGADIASDFDHLGCKFLFRIQNNSHALLFDNENNCIYNYIQWARTNFKKF